MLTFAQALEFADLEIRIRAARAELARIAPTETPNRTERLDMLAADVEENLRRTCRLILDTAEGKKNV